MHMTIINLAAAIVLGAAAYLAAAPDASADEATLYKTPQCSCCEDYADYLRENGLTVTVIPTHEVASMSREAGIPDDFQGCHLTFIDDYVVSGHVPIEMVNKLLSERPDIKGITLPGMPMGSPGMSGEKRGDFTVYEASEAGDSRLKAYATE
jgi:hypothetical protein